MDPTAIRLQLLELERARHRAVEDWLTAPGPATVKRAQNAEREFEEAHVRGMRDSAALLPALDAPDDLGDLLRTGRIAATEFHVRYPELLPFACEVHRSLLRRVGGTPDSKFTPGADYLLGLIAASVVRSFDVAVGLCVGGRPSQAAPAVRLIVENLCHFAVIAAEGEEAARAWLRRDDEPGVWNGFFEQHQPPPGEKAMKGFRYRELSDERRKALTNAYTFLSRLSHSRIESAFFAHGKAPEGAVVFELLDSDPGMTVLIMLHVLQLGTAAAVELDHQWGRFDRSRSDPSELELLQSRVVVVLDRHKRHIPGEWGITKQGNFARKPARESKP